jgi:hypothetical protein
MAANVLLVALVSILTVQRPTSARFALKVVNQLWTARPVQIALRLLIQTLQQDLCVLSALLGRKVRWTDLVVMPAVLDYIRTALPGICV